jgi:hypothetical protein
MLKDSLFKKIEEKTNVDKNTIMSLAEKIRNSNLKDEKVISELVDDLSSITGRSVSQEKKNKIIDMVKNDNVPNNLDNML